MAGCLTLSSDARLEQTFAVWHRTLESSQASRTNIVLWLLIVASALFAMMWMCTCCRRCADLLDQHTVMAATIEASLQAGGGRPDEQAPHGMTLDDRREFVSNVLVTKRVVAKVGAAVGVERTKEDLVVSTNLASSTHQIQPGGPDTVTTSCAICIMEYQDGEDICCSHNEQCKHVFHRDCIMEWLLRHDECPCCRHNFLSLNDDEDNRPEQSSAVTPAHASDESTTSSDGDPVAHFLRGLALFRTFARPSPPPRTESSPHVDEEQPYEYVDHELPVYEYFVNGELRVSNVNPNRIVEDDY